MEKISAVHFDEGAKYIINTGNILTLNDITRKSGQNTSEELQEAINITLNEFSSESTNGLGKAGAVIAINRPNDDLSVKIQEHSLTDLKIGVKVFVSIDNQDLIKEALNEVFKTLNVPSVNNVVLAFKKNVSENEYDLTSLKNVYSVLEEYVHKQKVSQIGLADVEESTFRNIYEWATVKPDIIQINLAACCVVPPTLQTFCKDKDVQLLTHSDPSDILPKQIIRQSCGGVNLPLRYIVRYSVHIKCRGVLITKGFLVSLGEP